MEAVKYKIQSFAHQELNNEKYLNNKMKNKIRLGLPIHESNSRFIPIKITDKNYPQYIVNNKDAYKHLICQDINQYIVIKNTIYYFSIGLLIWPAKRIIAMMLEMIKKIIEIILPRTVIDTLKKIKRKL